MQVLEPICVNKKTKKKETASRQGYPSDIQLIIYFILLYWSDIWEDGIKVGITET
jgi:hypothetical protein